MHSSENNDIQQIVAVLPATLFTEPNSLIIDDSGIGWKIKYCFTPSLQGSASFPLSLHLGSFNQDDAERQGRDSSAERMEPDNP